MMLTDKAGPSHRYYPDGRYSFAASYGRFLIALRIAHHIGDK